MPTLTDVLGAAVASLSHDADLLDYRGHTATPTHEMRDAAEELQRRLLALDA